MTTFQRYSSNWARFLLYLIQMIKNKECSNIYANILLYQFSLWIKVDVVFSAAIFF